MNQDNSLVQVVSARNANPLTGIETANSTAVINCNGMNTVGIQITPSNLTSVLTPQVSNDSDTWVTMGGTPLLSVGAGTYSATIAASTSGMWQADVAGFQYFRLSANSAVTGSATVRLRSSSAVGLVALDAPIPAGTNAIGTVTATPSISATAFTLNSAATTNATSVKTSAGSLLEISATNLSASSRYLKLYNKASAPTVGTDVPIHTIIIPANNNIAIHFGALGRRFTTGIAYAITAGQPIADTAAIGAGEVQVFGTYL